MTEYPIDRVRREATEQQAWGEPTFRVRKKIFAMYANAGNHHGDGQNAVWVKAPIGVQEMLIRSAPETYFMPPYVGVKGWVGVVLDAIDDAELGEQVVQSYCMIAPKKLAAQVGG